MELPQQELEAFVQLYQKEYNVTLSPEEAAEEFSKLLQLYVYVYGNNTHF